MIIEEIVNEIDKFITKYKALKSDNQTLTQFKSDVKTALNNKGIISTNNDEDVVQSINNYTSSTNGSTSGTSLNVDDLKYIGLLPADYSKATVESSDLIKLAETIIQDSKILSSAESVVVKDKADNSVLDITGEPINSTEYSSLDKNKYYVGFGGENFKRYQIPFKFGTHNYTVSITNKGVTRDKDISVTTTAGNLADSYIRIVYDVKKGMAIPGVFTSYVKYLVSDSSNENLSKIRGVFNSYSNQYSSESVGLVKNLRTGLVKELTLSLNYDENVSTMISENMISRRVGEESYKYSFIAKRGNSLRLSVKGSLCLFKVDGGSVFDNIGYQEGDILELLLSTPDSSGRVDLISEYNNIAPLVKNTENPITDPVSEDVEEDGRFGILNRTFSVSGPGGYADKISYTVKEFTNGIKVKFTELDYSTQGPANYQRELTSIWYYYKGSGSFLELDFTNVSNKGGQLPQNMTNSQTFENIEYLSIKINRDQVFKEVYDSNTGGYKVTLGYDTIQYNGAGVVSGNQKVKFNNTDYCEFPNDGRHLEYSFITGKLRSAY
nr:MAG TPA: hypothetical protein [Bacteriophage sp.]